MSSSQRKRRREGESRQREVRSNETVGVQTNSTALRDEQAAAAELRAAILWVWQTRHIPVEELFPRPATPRLAEESASPPTPPEPRLVVVSRAEEEWTRDQHDELPDGGGYDVTFVRPNGDGWGLWNTLKDRHSGWIRVWRPDGTVWEPPPEHRRVMETETFFSRGGEQQLDADDSLYADYVRHLPRVTVEERDAALARSADSVIYAVTFSAAAAPSPSYESECGCRRVVFHLDRRWRL